MPIDKKSVKAALDEHQSEQKAHNAALPRAVRGQRPLYWLAQNKIALCNLHILAAPLAAGASCLLTHWAAQLSRGEQLIPNHINEEGWGAVCYLQRGHDIARVEYPRLEAAGADQEQVIVTPIDDIYELDDVLKEIKHLKLLIVDADFLFLDEDQNISMRVLVQKLDQVAKALNIAVILMTKLAGRRAEAERKLEEVCLFPEVSVVFTLERRGDDRVLRLVRNRIGNDEDALRFRLTARELETEGETAPVLEWLPSNIPDGSKHRFSELEKCIHWVRSFAVRGMRSNMLYEIADQMQGFSKSTVARALVPAGFKSCMITGSDDSRFAVILHLLDDPKTAIDKGMLLGANQLDDDEEL